MANFLVVVVTLTLLGASRAELGINCDGTQNFEPIYSDPLVYIATTDNGILYQTQNITPPISVVHVYGTPYQMGYAHGTLLNATINEFFPEVFQYLYEEIGQYIGFLPPELQKLIEEVGVAAALDITYELTKPYIPAHFMQEMQGISDATTVPMQNVVQLMLLPEAIKAHCSMFGAWGSAISKTNGTMYVLRALDWNTNGPFQQYPAVIVYHPPAGNGQDFAIFGWAGFIGALTGFSNAPLALCEKVWLSYNGTSSRRGIPWDFLTRDILQYSVDINSAISRMADAARTCSIYIGLGDYTNTFVAVEYSHTTVNVGDNRNFPTWQDHPSLNDLVYIDKHVQPSTDPCLPSLLETFYGYISPETTIRNITSVFQTGDMHIAIADFAKNLWYLASAAPYVPGQPQQMAYSRPFVVLNMTTLFNMPPPSNSSVVV